MTTKQKTSALLLGLIPAFALDLLIGYLLNTILTAGIIVIPYVIFTLIYLFDKEGSL